MEFVLSSSQGLTSPDEENWIVSVNALHYKDMLYWLIYQF
jgi:hypothetical protein